MPRDTLLSAEELVREALYKGEDGKVYFRINTTGITEVPDNSGQEIALNDPQANLTANTDTPFTFASKIRHLFIQNNTAANLNINLDAVANLGSILIKPGEHIAMDISTTVIHLISVPASPVNGNSGSNIVLKGWV